MTFELLLELLQPGDEDALRFCSEYLSASWGRPLDIIRERVLKYASGVDGEFCVLARVNRELIGMMVCYRQTGMKTDGVYEPWSAGLYVDERFRNQGIGTKILERVLSEARCRGFTKIHLATNEDHLRKWYASLGWKQVGKAYGDKSEYDVFVFELETGSPEVSGGRTDRFRV